MKAVELSRVKDEKSLDFFFREVEVMRVRKDNVDPSTFFACAPLCLLFRRKTPVAHQLVASELFGNFRGKCYHAHGVL